MFVKNFKSFSKAKAIAFFVIIVCSMILLSTLYFSLQKIEKTPVTVNAKPSEKMHMKAMGKTIKLSKKAQKLAEVEVFPVVRKFIPFKSRLYGRVDYDETKLANITAWVPARIEKLYVNFTGVTVKKDVLMAEYYSPELIIAQEELIQSLKAFQTLKNTATSFAKDQSKRNLESAEVKLRLFGISQEKIDEIKKTKKVQKIIQVRAPISGVVIHKNILEGAYVKEGTKMFTIADLNTVWVQLEAYESDLQGLTLGQKVKFKTDAYPGEVFVGKIQFIDPFLDEKRRTASVRLEVNNKDGKLKPGMYVTATVQAYLNNKGKPTSLLPDELPPFVIPETAPLITGKRAIVYVRDPDNSYEYHLREIVLGPKVSNYYVVYSGLKEGELVVIKGNFKIDSAAQIEAKPSMMSPEGGIKTMKGHGGH